MVEDNDDIFNKDRLLKIWQAEREARNFNTTLIWENVKFIFSFLVGLLTAHGVLLAFLWSVRSFTIVTLSGFTFNWFGIALLAFPAAMINLS